MKTVTTIGLDIAKRWRVDGPDQLAVISGDGETAAEVMLRLDSEGRIDGAFAPDRPAFGHSANPADAVEGPVSDYRHHNRSWLPFAAKSHGR